MPHDNVHIRIDTDPDTDRELYEIFSFDVPGAKYMPLFRKRHWDGRIHLYKRGLLYRGLATQVETFCRERGYEFESLLPEPEPDTPSLIDFPIAYQPRNYQDSSYWLGVERRRALFLSPTGSGKTQIIYMLARHYATHRVLIIVPTTTLVHQGLQDFAKYGYTGSIKGIVAGEDRQTSADIVFSTWQSVMRENPEWVQQFDTVIVDECHLAQGKSITKILEAATATNRFGFTATLSGSETHEMILTGLFGAVERVVTTRELMDRGILAEARITMLNLQHPKAACKLAKKFKYQEEIQYLIDCDMRNEFIAGLATKIKGNTLILYTRVEQHGERIFNKLVSLASGHDVHFIHGGVDGKDRNAVREIVEGSNNAIVVASFGTFATGIDIARLHNLILASPHKSKILIPQALGRGLRVGSDKAECQIYDLVDDLRSGKKPNYVLNHAEARMRIYYEMMLDVTFRRVELDYTPNINKLEESNKCPLICP